MKAKQKHVQVNKGRENSLLKACLTRSTKGSAPGYMEISSGSYSDP